MKKPAVGGRAGRAAQAGRKPVKQKGSKAGKLLLAALTCCNLALSVALHLLRRQEILRAVEEDGRVKLLLTSEKRNQTEGKP